MFKALALKLVVALAILAAGHVWKLLGPGETYTVTCACCGGIGPTTCCPDDLTPSTLYLNWTIEDEGNNSFPNPIPLTYNATWGLWYSDYYPDADDGSGCGTRIVFGCTDPSPSQGGTGLGWYLAGVGDSSFGLPDPSNNWIKATSVTCSPFSATFGSCPFPGGSSSLDWNNIGGDCFNGGELLGCNSDNPTGPALTVTA